ncbi:MAG TPA: universal stress protein [Polyangiales bacterium]|nr:universal stress protein [Polyangiales bacterium]
MKPFKKILVPSDFSPYAEEALRTAVDLAVRYDATITIAHAYEPLAYTLPDGYVLLSPQQHADVLTAFSKSLASAKSTALAAGARNVETEQLQGIAASEIVERARAGGFDLIVMGTHGRKGFSHVLLGSVAERVLRHASCPVLVVKVAEQA